MSRTVLLVLVASLLAGVLSGCSELGGAGGAEGAAEGPLSGEWVDLSGSRVRFTGDVFYTNADDETRPHFRYEIVSEDEIALVPLVLKDGTEVASVGQKRTEAYGLEGDHLTLHGWGEYYRPGSQALSDAETASQARASGQNAFQDRLMLEACRAVRANYVAAFEGWFDARYEDRDSYGYTIPQYIKYKGIDVDWSFARFKSAVGKEYSAAATDYEENDIPDEYRSAVGFLEWVYAGKCPAGGTLSVKWSTSAEVVPQMSCSTHGGQ